MQLVDPAIGLSTSVLHCNDDDSRPAKSARCTRITGRDELRRPFPSMGIQLPCCGSRLCSLEDIHHVAPLDIAKLVLFSGRSSNFELRRQFAPAGKLERDRDSIAEGDVPGRCRQHEVVPARCEGQQPASRNFNPVEVQHPALTLFLHGSVHHHVLEGA